MTNSFSIYCDNNWLVVNKPSGISTHRAHEGDLGLVEWLSLHHDIRVHTCSRLDKGTSGVLVFALTPEAVAIAQNIHEEEQAQKTYFFIAPKSAKAFWVCFDPLDGKSCKTTFEKVREGKIYDLYKAIIHRGRTHQIRRHAAQAGIPLLGDDEYKGSPFVRLCLHCCVVQWPGIDQQLQAALPPWFTLCLDGITDKVIALALAGKRYPFLAGITDCCRLIHRGEYPLEDIAIDKYGQWLCVTGFDELYPAKQLLHRMRSVFDTLTLLCDCKGGVVKTNLRDPHKRKLFADIASWGEAVPESFLGREHDLHFTLTLNERQHPGLFLDQRDSRSKIAKLAQGKRVANLFAFTCSFSIYALAAGAEVVFSVDLAAGCLKRGQENVVLNRSVSAGNAKFIKEDVRKWLGRQLRKKRKDPAGFVAFDVVICDPPVFASAGKGKSFHVENEWPDLVRDVYGVLGENGIALFSNNHQAGNEAFYYETLTAQFSEVRRLNPPMDFPQPTAGQAHVRIYWCQK
jgi:23S rRNA (cytosine1962-C5)-methyltransferase